MESKQTPLSLVEILNKNLEDSKLPNDDSLQKLSPENLDIMKLLLESTEATVAPIITPTRGVSQDVRPHDFSSLADQVSSTEIGDAVLASRFGLGENLDPLADFVYENIDSARGNKTGEEKQEVDLFINPLNLAPPSLPIIDSSNISTVEDNRFQIENSLITNPQDTLVSVTLSDIPTGSTALINGVPVTITGNTLFITGADLPNLELIPPLNSDIDFTLSVAVTVSGPNSQQLTASGPLPVIVAPDADGVDHLFENDDIMNTVEDVPLEMSPVIISLKDSDGSESATILLIKIDPALGQLQLGNQFSNASGELSVSIGLTGGTTSFSLNGLTLHPTEDSSLDVPVTYSVLTTDVDTEGLFPNSSIIDTWTQTIAITPVVDTPDLSPPSLRGTEDTPLHIPATTITLGDLDGSETLGPLFTLSDIPQGTQIFLGDPNLGGTPQGVSAESVALNVSDLNNVYLIPPENSSDNFDLTLTITVIDQDPDSPAVDTSTFSTQIPISISAVVDGVILAEGSDKVGIEDQTVYLDDVSISLQDVDGSESASELVITFTPGFTVTYGNFSSSTGSLTIPLNLSGGSPSIILSGMTVVPPLNSDQDVTLNFSVTTTDIDPDSPNNIDTTTLIKTVDVIIQADADAPTINTATGATGPLQNPVPITLDIDPSEDNDGSEVLTIDLAGFPEGTLLTATSGLNAVVGASGTITIAPGDQGGLAALFPNDASGIGTFPITVTAISTELETAAGQVFDQSEEVSAPFEMTTLPFGIANLEGTEDQFVSIPITQSTNPDIQIESLQISNIPEGATIQVTGLYSGGGWTDDGTYSFYVATAPNDSTVITDPTPSVIKSFLDSLEIKGPEDSDLNFPLDFSGTLFSAQTYSPPNVSVILNVDADVPLNVTFGNQLSPTDIIEDTWNVLPITGNLKDTDGSETLSFMINNVPDGSSFAADILGTIPVGTITGTNGDGTKNWTFTPSSDSEIFDISGQSIEDTLFFKPPLNFPTGPTFYDLDLMTLNVTALDSESELIDTIASDTAFATADIETTVTAVTDPLQDVTYQVKEDTAVTIQALDFLTDQDGSEAYIGNITITNIPVGAVLMIDGIPYSEGSDISGGQIIFDSQYFDGMTIQPPLNSDVDFSVRIAGTTQDNPGGLPLPFDQELTLQVDAVIDAPILNITTVPGDEEVGALVNIDASLGTDIDGSETVVFVRALHFQQGAEFVDGSGAQVGSRQGNHWVFDPEAGPPEQAYDYLNENNLFVRWIDQDNSNNISFKVQLQAKETNLSGVEYDSSDNTKTIKTSTIIADILPKADAVAFEALPQKGLEDTQIPLNLAVKLTDLDTSEAVTSVTLEFFEIGTSTPLSISLFSRDGNLISPTAPGIYTISQAEILGLKVLPPLHSNEDFDVKLTTVVTDTALDEPSQIDTLTETRTITVSVVGDADDPILEDIPAVNEDTAIILNDTLMHLTDTDGSEVLSGRLKDLPPGASISGATNIGNGEYIFSYTIGGVNPPISIIPPENYSGSFEFDLRLVSTENDGDSNVKDFRPVVTINPQADMINISVGGPVTEDLGFQAAPVTLSLTDTDGSEILPSTVTLDSILGDPGAQVRINGTTLVNPGDLISVSDLSTLEVLPSENSNVDIQLTFSTLSTDGSSTLTTTSTVVVDVIGDADVAPVIAEDVIGDDDNDDDDDDGSEEESLVGNETLPLPLTSAFVDNDSSETHYIIIDNVPDSWSIENPNGPPLVYIGDNKWLLPPDPTASTQSQEFDYLSTLLVRRDGTAGTILDDFLSASPSGSSETLSIISVSRENDGDYDYVSTDVTVTFTGTPVDSPNQTPPTINPMVYSGDEDTGIDFSGLITGTGDLSVTLYNLPLGSSLSSGTFFEAGTVPSGVLAGGFWVVPESELTTLEITPPQDFSGTLEFDIIATSSATGTIGGSNAGTITATINPIADEAEISSNASGDEDVLIPLNISYILGDGDTDSARGVESIIDDPTILYLTGIPLGSILYSDNGTTVIPDSGGGIYSVNLADLPNLHIMAPPQSNVDFSLTLHYSVIDENTTFPLDDTRAFTANIPVDVIGVPDLPSIDPGDAINIAEDTLTLIPLDINITSDEDLDGSETTFYKISGLPLGVTLDVGNNQGDGVWIVPEASISSVAMNIPGDFSANFTISIHGLVLENDGGFLESTAVTKDITITPFADIPAVIAPANLLVNEDDQLSYEIPLSVSTSDIDGSETFDILISSFPTGFTFNQGVSSGADWLISGLTVNQLTTLQNLEVFVPEHFSGSVSLDYKIAATDGLDTQEVTVQSTIEVTPVADMALTSILPSLSGEEDQDVTIPLDIIAVDNDGSETFRVEIEGYPSGMSFDQGSEVAGTWVIDNLSSLDLTSLSTLQMTPPSDYSGTDTLTFNVYSRETANGAEALTTISSEITLTPVTDAATLSILDDTLSTLTGVGINLGLDIQLQDMDGSETLLVEISGAPEFSLNLGTYAAGVYTVEQGDVADLEFTNNASNSYNLVISATSQDSPAMPITIVDNMTIEVI